MTGSEHYVEAERLLKDGHTADLHEQPGYFAEAQVHATLALVAAVLELSEGES